MEKFTIALRVTNLNPNPTAGIGLHVNAHKTEYMCFNQTGDISSLDGSSLKPVDKFTYLGSSVSSTENDIDTRLTKTWTAIDKLSRAHDNEKKRAAIEEWNILEVTEKGNQMWQVTLAGPSSDMERDDKETEIDHMFRGTRRKNTDYEEKEESTDEDSHKLDEEGEIHHIYWKRLLEIEAYKVEEKCHWTEHFGMSHGNRIGMGIKRNRLWIWRPAKHSRDGKYT